MCKYPILYVEDEENDVFFLRRALDELNVLHPLQTVGDAQRAIEYLAGTGPFADRGLFPLPGLVLLDINLPSRSGFHVLRWMRAQASLKKVVALVYTSSDQTSDIEMAYELGANAYLVKPHSQEKLLELVQSLRDFWLQHNQLAPSCAENPHGS